MIFISIDYQICPKHFPQLDLFMISSQIYYSDDELPQSHLSKIDSKPQEHKDNQSNDFERKIKNFYHQLKTMLERIPLKDTIVLQPENNSQHSQPHNNNQTFYEQAHQRAHTSHPNAYPKTRSRGTFEPIPTIQELQEKPRPSRSTPQTKFRHRRFNKLKRAKGPQPDYYRMFLQRCAKIEEWQEKQTKPLYYSDDETEPGQQGDKEGMQALEEQKFTTYKQIAKQIQQRYNNTEYYIKQSGSSNNYHNSEKISGGELKIDWQGQQQVSSKNEDRPEKGELKYQQEISKELQALLYSGCKPSFNYKKQLNGEVFVINKDNIPRMFEQCSLNLDNTRYEAENGQNPFFKALYTKIKDDISYRRENQRSSHHLMKGRLYVVRRIMEIYSSISPKEHKEEEHRYIRNRLTNKERSLFVKAGLPCPPCRPTNGFMEKLFENKQFGIFFKGYVQSGSLNELLIQKSKKEIRTFQNCYRKIPLHDSSIEQMLKQVDSKPLPLSHLEISIFYNQAVAICKRYCRY